jgi:SAM-dependent methyltransferase
MTRELSGVEAKQKQYYNEIASEYDRHYASPEALRYRQQIYMQILRDIPLEGKDVLDAMCGGGQNTAALAGTGCRVVGLDLSEGQCEQYAQRFPDARARCGSVLDTGFPDASFDLIVCDSLHHLHPYVNDGVRELLRLLRPGGHLLVWEPSAGSVLDLARKLWYRLDPKYFEENEAAIDLERLARTHAGALRMVRRRYGGNVAYLLVFTSMVFRIPVKVARYLAPVLMPVERALGILQTRLTSLWVLGLLQKPAAGK